MKLITRDIINKNLVTHNRVDGSYDTYEIRYDKIVDSIDKAKLVLIKNFSAQKGQTVLLCVEKWPEYIVWFFACAELGMSFITFDYTSLKHSRTAITRLGLFDKVDHIILDTSNEELYYGLSQYADALIDKDSYITVTVEDTPIWASEDSILIYSTSSGTEETPKTIAHTHEFFFDLAERNGKIYELTDDDRCLHFKGLHHGSVTGVYFLPTIKYCSHHYYSKYRSTDNTIIEYWISVLRHHKISRCMLFYGMLEHLANFSSKETSDLKIYVLSGINKQEKYVEKLVKEGYEIYSIFGCSETSGPILLPHIARDNFEKFNNSNFGKVLDDFYTLTLDNDVLKVQTPHGITVSTGDEFEIINDEYFHRGRKKISFMDNTIAVIEEHLGIKHQNEFDIVFDILYNQLYIRINFDVDLTDLNTYLKEPITKKVVSDRIKFMYGIKFDAEGFREHCRKLGDV